MSILNRINRFIKKQKKKARAAYRRRLGHVYDAVNKKPRSEKRRGHDYTMRW